MKDRPPIFFSFSVSAINNFFVCLNDFKSEFGVEFLTTHLNSPEMQRMFDVNSKSPFGSMSFMGTN